MKFDRIAVAAFLAFAPAAALAADIPVTYLVDESALKAAVSGTNLTFELHNDSLCAGVVHSAVLSIDNVVVSRIKRFKPSGGTKPPRTAEIRATLTGVTAPGHFFLEVTGNGVMPLGDACQAQAATGDIPPTCSDTIQNQDESDVDCGGVCAGCPVGDGCSAGSDCQSGVCTSGVCAATCTDGIADGNETDVDCGGGTCDPCAENQTCTLDSDCETTPALLTCYSGVCTSHCFDGVTNGDETDVNCGGSECPARCDPGQTCLIFSDCASGVCMGGNTCQ